MQPVVGTDRLSARRGSSTPVVELVSADGASRGSMDKLRAHQSPGHLHRAFSVLLLDEDGRVLLQRRAAGKYHFAGRWTNSCCGHPAPGIDVVLEAQDRTFAELGLDVSLELVGSFQYQAADETSGLVEHELDTVLVGRLPRGGAPAPDPAEVSATRLVTVRDLEAELAQAPGAFTPWLPQVLACALGRSGAADA
jgi:isopentenyl-diphosphate delta-isomerase